MEEPLTKSEVEESKDRPTCTENLQHDLEALSGPMSRKEKRKAMKKLKRKQIRKEIAVKEREEEEARLNDPEEQRRIQLMEQEEAERIERERKEFEEKEKAWIEALEMKKKEAAEEEERKALEESQNRQHEEGNESNEEDNEWEYVEEGPPEIIWQGNEIIFKKKKVRVPKKDASHQNKKEDAERPTSNPLPPESEDFADYTSLSIVSAQQVLGNVAQQVPNFGTEQDKAHCPFHLKTGACRFGQRCSRVHFYPDKSCTLLVKNMYNGPGLAWEQDEVLEYTDEEVECCFEEFYEDVHTEFLKFGEIVNFKVCKNGSFHLRGNVYIQYKLLDSALLAYNSINGRYFAGKQVRCEFVNVTRWKVAICGEYMKSGFKTCSHGTACNFIHCFRNPGRDYEWADSDKPPPKYWVRMMAALFGNSGDYQKVMGQENSRLLRNSSKTPETDSDRYQSRRSTSREMDKLYHGDSGRRKNEDKRMHTSIPDEEICEETILKDKHKRKGRTCDNDSSKEWLNVEDREKHHKRARRSSITRNKDGKIRTHELDSDDDREKHRGSVGRSSRQMKRDTKDWTFEAESDREELDRDRERRRKMHHSRRKSSRYQNGDGSNVTSEADADSDCSGKDGDRARKRNCSERENSRHHNRDSSNVTEAESREDQSDGDKDRKMRRHHRKRERSRHRNRDSGSEAESDGDRVDRDTIRERERHHHKRRSSRHQKRGSRNVTSEAKYDEVSFEKDGGTKS